MIRKENFATMKEQQLAQKTHKGIKCGLITNQAS